jgi:phasin family protein
MSYEKKITDAIETTGATTAAIAVKNLEQTKAQLKQGADAAVKNAEAVVSFNQGNIEALTRSAQIWATGMQDLTKHVAASFQASTQEALSFFKTIGTVKSVKEAIDLQSNFARHTLNKAIAEGGRFTEASVQLSRQAMQPLTERVKASGQTFGSAN